MSIQTVHIKEDQVGVRTDKFIAARYPQFPRAALQKLFESGHILLNDETTKPGIKLRLGDVVQVDLSPLNITIPNIDLPILYEDDDVLVVDKPAGVISHARGRFFDEPSVASFVRQKVASLTGERAGIVHRLDRATSGVMICAKNQEALYWLQRQFSDRKVQKTYVALIEGHMPSETGIIDMPIARNPSKPQTFHISEGGKPAQTQYEETESGKKYSLVILQPQTGRTHQLRVHLQKLGHPIVGDALYNGREASRLMLHAHKLELVLPSKQSKVFISPVPDLFNELLTK